VQKNKDITYQDLNSRLALHLDIFPCLSGSYLSIIWS